MERGFCGCPACFGWRIFCAQVGAYFRARLGPLVCVFVGARPCCVSVFFLRSRSVVWSVFRARLGPGGVARILCAALGLSCLL